MAGVAGRAVALPSFKPVMEYLCVPKQRVFVLGPRSPAA